MSRVESRLYGSTSCCISHIYYHLILLFPHSKLAKNTATKLGFQYDLMKIRKWLTFWATLYTWLL